VILRIILGLWMCGVIVAAFLVAPRAEMLGDLSRIIYFHVPVAWVTVLAFVWSMVQSIIYLARRNRANDVSAEAAARIGMIFCALATVTGMVFAKVTWGAYWNWDPRETSIFILLLIYLAYFALRMSVGDPERRAKISAVYAILAAFTVPFLVFVIPRMFFSLHPSPVTDQGGMDTKMKIVFFASLAGFTGLYVWLQNLSVRTGMLVLKKEEE
jgi:heme exporter protein C